MNGEQSDGSSEKDRAFLGAVERWKEALNAGRQAEAEEALGEANEAVMEGVTSEELEMLEKFELSLESELKSASSNATRECCPREDCLFWILGLRETALQQAQAETEQFRQFDFENAYLLAVFLFREASIHVRLSNVPHAMKLIEEGLSLVGDQRVTDTYRAELLILRAWCRIIERDFFAASEDLDSAKEILYWYPVCFRRPVIHDAMSFCWAVTGLMRTAFDDHQGAVVAWSEAVTECQKAFPYMVTGRWIIANRLKQLAAAYRRNGQELEAEDALTQRHEILRKLNLPSNS